MSWVYFALTKTILQPLPILLLLLGAGLANLWRARKESRTRLLLPTISFFALVVATTPAAVYPLFAVLEQRFPLRTARPEGVEALVVLAGGINEPNEVRPRPEIAEDTLYRCLHAAELYHQGKPCPVIVTGGALNPNSTIPPVAPSMREFLVQLGVAESDVILEPNARTTYENAVETRKILKRRGLGKVLLVTEAIHMFRSLRCFRKQGVDAVPAACHHQATGFQPKLDSFVPTPVALESLMTALHEYLGLAWYWTRGKI